MEGPTRRDVEASDISNGRDEPVLSRGYGVPVMV